MFRHPSSFIFVGFHLTSLVDKGERLTVEETRKMLNSGTLIKKLQEKYGLGFDMSLYNEDELAKIEGYFESQFDTEIGRRKYGVENNGLCFLIAYCFEAAQRDESEMNFHS